MHVLCKLCCANHRHNMQKSHTNLQKSRTLSNAKNRLNLPMYFSHILSFVCACTVSCAVSRSLSLFLALSVSLSRSLSLAFSLSHALSLSPSSLPSPPLSLIHSRIFSRAHSLSLFLLYTHSRTHFEDVYFSKRPV